MILASYRMSEVEYFIFPVIFVIFMAYNDRQLIDIYLSKFYKQISSTHYTI